MSKRRPFFLDKVDAVSLKLLTVKTFDHGGVELVYANVKTAAGQAV